MCPGRGMEWHVVGQQCPTLTARACRAPRKVAVLVENNSEQKVQLGPSYVLAQAHPMVEREVGWARGHFSIDQVCFILQQQQEADGNETWPTDKQLKSRGPNSWWDPCKGKIEAERMLRVEEVFKLDKNEYLKKNPQ